MNDKEKRAFIKDLARNVVAEVLAKVPHMPDDWDGHELRRYLADEFEASNIGLCRRARPFRGAQDARRVRAYNNEIIIRNL